MLMQEVVSDVAVRPALGQGRFRRWVVAGLGHLGRVMRANLIIAVLLWQCRPILSLLRWLVLMLMIGTPFLMSWAMGRMVAAITSGSGITLDHPGVVALIGALIVGGVLPLAVAVLDRLIEHWLFQHVQQEQVRQVPGLDPVTYGDPALKDTIQEVQERAVWRIMAMARGQLVILRAVALAVIAALMLGGFDGSLPLLVVTAMVPAMIMEGWHACAQFQIDERQKEWWRSFWEDRWNLFDAKGLAFLQVFGAARWFADRFARGIGQAIGEHELGERRSIVPRLLVVTLGFTALGITAWHLIRAGAAGQLPVDRLVFLLGALGLLGGSLAELAGAIGQQLGQSRYVMSYRQVLAITPATRFPAATAVRPEISGGLTLTVGNVRFSYPAEPGKPAREVLRGLSFEIPAGQKWALLGVNGSGKSTTLAILTRLHDPLAGEVLLGGVPAGEVSEPDLRRLIGCLPQRISHYNLRVREFIGLGAGGGELDLERVRWAAQRSGAASFIEQYPDGYDQRLGSGYKGAEEPSGGQLQKLALAALLYLRAPLMVLDEPTAAIDPEAARAFWDALFTETPGQTVLFSTHYLGVVRRADRILVIDAGRVLAEGTHPELLERCPIYRAQFEGQARDFGS